MRLVLGWTMWLLVIWGSPTLGGEQPPAVVVTEDDQQIRIETACRSAAIAKSGYVSGVSGGTLIDIANLGGSAWPAGSGSPGFYSMEPIDPAGSDSANNWAGNNGITRNGLDANGNPINGTPKQINSMYLTTPTPTATPPARQHPRRPRRRNSRLGRLRPRRSPCQNR